VLSKYGRHDQYLKRMKYHILRPVMREIEENRTKYFQLEGTYNDCLVQLLDNFRADQKLRHTKGIVQMPLKH